MQIKELEILLENFWIIKDQDKDLYNRIKDASPKFKNFLEEKLGLKLIINPYMIKLEKLPGKAEPWMGIQEFEEKIEYAFLCLLLIFLEDKGQGDQFVLSQATEFVQATFPGEEKADWTLFRHRKSMVKVLRFAAEMYLIKVNDGDESGFADSAETEVLYESTGLARYFVRNFTGNILNYSSWQDIENGEWLDADKDRGKIRRNRVYRRLAMSPVVYCEGPDDHDYSYIKNYRSMIQKDIEDMLGSDLHVHKNGAFVVLAPDKHFKDVFPDNKTISDIVLQINAVIVELLNSGELEKDINDIIHVSNAKFQSIIEKCRQCCQHGWSKEYREMKTETLERAVVAYMKGFGMIEEDEHSREMRIMPLAGRITGTYPADFV